MALIVVCNTCHKKGELVEVTTGDSPPIKNTPFWIRTFVPDKYINGEPIPHSRLDYCSLDCMCEELVAYASPPGDKMEISPVAWQKLIEERAELASRAREYGEWVKSLHQELNQLKESSDAS